MANKNKKSKGKNQKRKIDEISLDENDTSIAADKELEKEENIIIAAAASDPVLLSDSVNISQENVNDITVKDSITVNDSTTEVIPETATQDAHGADAPSNTTCTPVPVGEETTQAKPIPENPYDSIRYCIISNDGSRENWVKLIGLKSLFAKMLPKMPKEYIVRLVFDKRHKSLAILSDDPAVQGSDEEIIGGICYRPYPDMRFAEIAFCAVSMNQQVKGYGTKLMNLLKQNAVLEGLEYLITYADNYAIGYFKKQGFSKNIAMPKGRYHGLIKDYDGGTMMECYVHPSIDFTRIPDMIQAQREFILSRVRLHSKSDKVVYPPLPPGWKANIQGTKRGLEAATKAMSIPGVAEAGWTIHDLVSSTNATKENDRRKSSLKAEILAIIQKVHQQQYAWPFRTPVDTKEVEDYLKVIKEPIDLSTMEKKAQKGYYESKKMLYLDMMKMVNNCKTFNEASTPYYECATLLETFVSSIFSDIETD